MCESLVIYSSKNVKGRKDATGAFIPEAKRFIKINNVLEKNVLAVPCVGISAAKRRDMVLSFVGNSEYRNVDIDVIAWFGHGWSGGIQFGFNNKNIEDLVAHLPLSNHKHILYACSTASTSKSTRNVKMPGSDGGFADVLRDAMKMFGYTSGWVDGHLQPGHTTRNPYVLRFDIGSSDTKGGKYLVKPDSKSWSTWVKVLRGDFRFRFPYMATDEIMEYLTHGYI